MPRGPATTLTIVVALAVGGAVTNRHAGQPLRPNDTLQPTPPDPLDAAQEAAARAIVGGAVQKIFARDSAERARRAGGASS